MNDVNRTQLEIHPCKGLKMNMVTDRWIHKCIGMSLLIVSSAVLLTALASVLYVIFRYA